MTPNAQLDTALGGASNGSPVGVPEAGAKRQRGELSLGMLPQPGIVASLRAAWREGDFLPAFDPRSICSREWRAAAILTLAGHVLFVGLIAAIGIHTLTKPNDDPREELKYIGEIGPAPDNPTEPAGPAPSDGGSAAPAGGAPKSGGGQQAATPPSPGVKPATAPVPVVPPSVVPPPLKQQPSLPITPTLAGPVAPMPEPGDVGVLGAPPAPPSPGPGEGGGMGTGKGTGLGDGTQAGTDNGPGGSGRPGNAGGSPNPSPSGGPSGTGPGGPGGTGTEAPPGVADKPVTWKRRVQPRVTPQMLESQTFGTITLRVTVGPNGEILNATPIQPLGNGGTEAALAALRQCAFYPAIRNGRYVTDKIVVSMTFKPQ